LGHETEKGGGRVVMEKRCKICGETYPLTDEYWQKGTIYKKYVWWDSYCKQCRKQYSKHYQKQYGHKYQTIKNEWNRVYIKELSDVYIKKLLKANSIDPTPEWIELKRIQISMKRTLCNIKKLLGGEYEPSHTDV
jgi:hypothetical protein